MSLIQTSALQLPAKASTGGNATGVPSGIVNEFLVSELLPRYSNLAKLGRIQMARAAAVTLSAAATGMTGLIIYNNSLPVQGVDLHLLFISGVVVVTSASMTGISLGFGTQGQTAPTGITAATQTSSYLGAGAAGQFGLAYSAATVAVAPTGIFDCLHNTAAIATTGEDNGFEFDFGGSVIIPPGEFVAFIAGGAASAASAVNLSAIWAALPA
jgi:hypothetical protein